MCVVLIKFWADLCVIVGSNKLFVKGIVLIINLLEYSFVKWVSVQGIMSSAKIRWKQQQILTCLDVKWNGMLIFNLLLELSRVNDKCGIF